MDLKQLQYFVACAQTGSFSDAAKVLYSTQPSVSKVIKSLEDTLGMQLFERLPRGIRLTVQGQKVYHYACRITNEIDVLENMASRGMTKWVRISMNPSSWFANQFVDFYNETFEKNYHFQLTTAGVRSVMERVRDYMDDIGFVYILSQQQDKIHYTHPRSPHKVIAMTTPTQVANVNFMIPEKRKSGWKNWRGFGLSRIIRTNSLILVLCRRMRSSGEI